MNEHEKYMQRCLYLASLGAGRVAPNPMVGAVLVHNHVIIGEGYHKMYGDAHAEVNCLNSVHESKKHLIPHSTLYVSLEPCNHYGKTPPCSGLIIQHRIPTVVVATTDPFEKVNGSGIRKLQEAGVDVTVGVCENDAIKLNKRFFTFHLKKRPYVILKWAQSVDGKIASHNKQPVKISNQLTDRLVHQWRSEEAGILVGTQTVLSDNPSLTIRLWSGHNPVRVVIDRNLAIPTGYHVFDQSATTIIINTVKHGMERKNLYHQVNKPFITVSDIMDVLFQHQINSVIIEGGTKMLQSFIDAGIWDEARVICNRNLKIPGGIPSPVLAHETMTSMQLIIHDELAFYSNHPKA